MKKTFKTLATLFLLALTSLSFTSCEDEMIASTLEGTWEGNMYISSEWEGRVYDATYTEIEWRKRSMSTHSERSNPPTFEPENGLKTA